ncbi:PD-(D/E)XK motif protein [Mucilaginibacter sp. CAU 1740]|uniref:PD-(D/E)XK motif protein n=1 Tax=Mucilaginibacter sp. CAU 1740 TaxID=3140365 RepID=UPI00325BB350
MKLQWDILLNDDSRFPRLLFFGEFADERFRYGIDAQMHYCLYFYFGPPAGNIPVEPQLRANISLEETIDEGKPVLVLTLLNDNAREKFSDLIVSIVEQTRNVQPASAKKAFVSLCNEWFELFEPLSGQLSLPALQGIFAELHFLKALLDYSRHTPNDILSAWKGPYGKGHDFEIGDNHFEIKSIAEFKQLVNISSEYQLDYLDGQQLLLGVSEFGEVTEEAITLSEIIGNIAALLRAVTGSKLHVLWTALSKAGIDYQSIQQYDHHNFLIKHTSWFNCTAEGFPSIKRTDLPDAVRSVKYDLALNNIQEFAISDISPFI